MLPNAIFLPCLTLSQTNMRQRKLTGVTGILYCCSRKKNEIWLQPANTQIFPSEYILKMKEIIKNTIAVTQPEGLNIHIAWPIELLKCHDFKVSRAT